MNTQHFTTLELQEAANCLLSGELVAFPTETVFGLGALATNEEAVLQIFKVKGRPQDNPLILHVSKFEQVQQYVQSIPPIATQLMQHFWPGPLTIIFNVKQGSVAKSVLAGSETIGIRMPNHPEALKLIEAVGAGVVAPSANKSGKPSPTLVQHVLHDFQGEIAGVVIPEDEKIGVGVESTVVKIESNVVKILRPGAITAEMISKVGLLVEEVSREVQLTQPHLLSPGVKYQHYSPKQPVTVVISTSYQRVDERIDKIDGKIGLLADDAWIHYYQNHPKITAMYSYGAKDDFISATQQLYAGLRYLELSDCNYIIAQGFPEEDATHAMMNRLGRAADVIVRE